MLNNILNYIESAYTIAQDEAQDVEAGLDTKIDMDYVRNISREIASVSPNISKKILNAALNAQGRKYFQEAVKEIGLEVMGNPERFSQNAHKTLQDAIDLS